MESIYKYWTFCYYLIRDNKAKWYYDLQSIQWCNHAINMDYSCEQKGSVDPDQLASPFQRARHFEMICSKSDY